MPKYRDMAIHIDKFETLFAKLERMGDETKIPESHKAPLLLPSKGIQSALGSKVAALRTNDTDKLSREDVTDRIGSKNGII